ncbi:MAG TPA: hypothetical protein VD790_05465 [Thermoleophilaceae bacterium]|nr:hypothetical protein [Thermoleophilaceae bacterium]
MQTPLRAALVIAVVTAVPALAQSPTDPVEEGAVEQSCRALGGGTAGIPDQVPAEAGGEPPASWPAFTTGPGPVVNPHLRTPTETFNRLYEFFTRAGRIYVRARAGDGPWRRMPLPLCFDGRVESIAVDDDELVALDTARRIYTMDNALKDASLFNWTNRWGTPFWTGPGYTLPPVKAWSWSVVSPIEDETWTDPAGNRTDIGAGKVSHIWGLRRGGQRLTFWDPWLPNDESYEMCGPHRGRFRAVNLSAGGSYVFLIGRRGDMFTRMYDFDISGHDPVFFSYSYEDQRGEGDGAPIQLPAERWTEQPKIPGRITRTISIHKTGMGTIHRVLRVEGKRRGRTGYWERDVADPPERGWTFHRTGVPLTSRPLRNPRRDTSHRRLGASENRRYGDLLNFNVYCSPARIRVGDEIVRLHHVDGLRQQARARGLDDIPRTQYGAVEDGGKFTEVTVQATRDRVVVEELGWTFTR